MNNTPVKKPESGPVADRVPDVIGLTTSHQIPTAGKGDCWLACLFVDLCGASPEKLTQARDGFVTRIEANKLPTGEEAVDLVPELRTHFQNSLVVNFQNPEEKGEKHATTINTNLKAHLEKMGTAQKAMGSTSQHLVAGNLDGSLHVA
jgi:hypothetical protein